MMESIIGQEGFDPSFSFQQFHTWAENSEAARKLFGDPYLHPSDIRWRLAEIYCETLKFSQFKGVHFETAMLATYLSDISSQREDYGKYTKNERTLRHFLRAMYNLAAWPKLLALFSTLPEHLSLVRTDKLENDKNHNIHAITACPEALYQIQFRLDRNYFGRIGFNVHWENGDDIWSITNIQGIKIGKEAYQDISDHYGWRFPNFLIRTVKDVSELDPNSRPILRGWKNPKNPNANNDFYNAVFKTENIDRWST